MSDVLHSYSKVYALGHPTVAELCVEPVLVQEKVDGSQFSFALTCDSTSEDGMGDYYTVKMRSKGAVIFPEAPPKLFSKAVEAVLALAAQLTPGYCYRAEAITSPRHNTLQYDRVPKHYFVVYDIEDLNKGPYNFLTWQQCAKECTRLGVEYLLPDDVGVKIVCSGDVAHQMQKPSMLGGAREGVVLKNYSRFTPDGKVMMGKYVSEKFKEVHAGAWKAANPQGTDVVEEMIRRLTTDARYHKAIQHLRERGELQGAVQDIGPLIREIQTDVIAEEADRIKRALFEWARPKIERGVVQGFPQWYKDLLVAKQFGEATNDFPTTYAPLGLVAPVEVEPLGDVRRCPAVVGGAFVEAQAMGVG